VAFEAMVGLRRGLRGESGIEGSKAFITNAGTCWAGEAAAA
jgi:hypothetical protein